VAVMVVAVQPGGQPAGASPSEVQGRA
jgi:hypothetical protein